MAIILQKGQKIDLTKGHPGLEKITVGLGWDPIQSKKKAGGLLGGLFGGGGSGGFKYGYRRFCYHASRR